MSYSLPIFLAVIGGILPALLWLWFWRREDRLHPEPRRLIFLCFLCGMAAVPLVIPLEKLAEVSYGASGLTFLLWAFFEEAFKYLAALSSVLTRKEVNEPIDEVIYMITAALGFSAMENAFFIINPLLQGDFANSFLTGNLRFIGAMLLHTVASATVGIFMAFAYYKKPKMKALLGAAGLFLAVVLHTMFNLTIIGGQNGQSSIAFYSVWIAAVIIILFFEKVKTISN